jgi:rod shape determining protein RodA
VLAVLSLAAFGFILLYSATGRGPEPTSEVERQLIWLIPGLAMMFIMALVDYEFWGKMHRWIYALNVLLLLLVMFVGHESRGSQRWLGFGSFTVQPSEIAKIFFIMTLSRFLSTREDGLSGGDILLSLIHLAIPMLLILKQPDLGTALVLLAVYLVLMFRAGVTPWFLAGLFFLGAVASPFVLKDYQKQRLLVFLNPEADPHGGGWSLIQSKIAIGSGKLLGKGLFAGTQGQLRFVPEHSTDFIFTVAGEEHGFVGSAIILALYFYIIWQAIRISSQARDTYGSLIAMGIMTMLLFHVVVNVGMNIGIMPITGIPLPFLSYGGSSLLTNMMAAGLLLGISFRRESHSPEVVL